jgi:hypothetical protein
MRLPKGVLAMSGYVFDPDGIRAAHAEWEQLLEDIRKDMEDGLAMLDILAPGREPASETLAVAGHDSGTAFQEHSESVQNHVQAFVDNLAAAGAGYLQEEESASGRFPSGGPR